MGFDAQFQEELRIYESTPSPAAGFDIISWWYHKRHVLPLLSSVARSLMVIPASSSKSKRNFSKFNA
jgi:hypothetical protein